MLRKSWRWLCRLTFWLAGAMLTIMLIAAMLIQFWIMPNINQYKNDIAAFATRTAQQKVTIGDIRARWEGINPHLSISRIEIFDAQNRPALSLNNIEISLSWLSIPLLEPHLNKLAIHSPELMIRRIASGEIFVAGISMNGESRPALPNWLLRQNTVEINQARIIWLDEKRSAPNLSLNDFNLQLHSPLWKGLVKNHSFSISTVPSVGTSQPILIDGSFYGNDVSKTQEWDGHINLQLKEADLTAFKTWMDYPLDIHTGVGSTNIKTRFRNHALESIASTVDIQNLQLQVKPGVSPVSLRKLSGNINWASLNKFQLLGSKSGQSGFTVSVDGISAIADSGLDIKNLKADYSEASTGKQSFNLELSSFNLASAHEYLAHMPLPDNLLEQMTAAAPSGMLENMKVHWEALNQKTTAYQVSSKFNRLSINAQRSIPGFSNVSGELKASQKGGQLQIDANNGKLEFKDILRWPIPIDSLNGKIRWDITDKVTEIKVSDLKISNPHLSGTIDASYSMDGIKGGYLDLTGKFDKGDAKFAHFYYPIMLGESTLHWLDTSILAGHAQDIDVKVKGRLADFPFVDAKKKPESGSGLIQG